MEEIPQLIARGGIAAAADQMAKWETTNQEHAVLAAAAVTDGKPIPRKVQRRTAEPDSLWRRRKDEERNGRHRCRICGHTDNADANAARNIRDYGVAAIRARMDASRGDAGHPPEGTDAGRKTVRQEQSRRTGTPVRSERAPTQGRSRFQPSHDDRTAHESWPQRETQEFRPNGQIS